jgi:hypothetical protein
MVSYGHPWAHYSSGYQDRLLGGPLGLLDLCYTAPDGVERKDYGGECRINLPGPTTSVGTRTNYSVGPWDYPACATRHLMA